MGKVTLIGGQTTACTSPSGHSIRRNKLMVDNEQTSSNGDDNDDVIIIIIIIIM
jgi:hypothetical protein